MTYIHLQLNQINQLVKELEKQINIGIGLGS